LLACFLVPNLVKAQKSLSVCELLDRRIELNGQIVTVRGELHGGYHGISLVPHDCKTKVITEGYEWPEAVCLRNTLGASRPDELQGEFWNRQADRSFVVTVAGRFETKEHFPILPSVRGDTVRAGFCHLNTAVAQLAYSKIYDLEILQPAYPLKLSNFPSGGDADGTLRLMGAILSGSGFDKAVEQIEKYYFLMKGVPSDWICLLLAESYGICVDCARNALKTLPSTLEGWKPPDYWWVSEPAQEKKDGADLVALADPALEVLLATTATGTMKALRERLWILSCRDHERLRVRARELLRLHFGVEPGDVKCPPCANVAEK
jgi:hypothetical protein